MRAVSLSDSQVISLLNRYFTPVYVSNEDYQDSGAASPEEKAELRRIFQEGYAAKRSVGTVHAYVLNPDGHLIDSMHVAQAYRSDNLIPMLERNVRVLGTQAGPPVVTPAPPPVPKCDSDSLLLHLTARYLERKGDDYVLIEDTGGNWSALPSVDWITLSRAEWTKLLPPSHLRVGQSWDIEREVASDLLKHFYPPTENWDLSTNRIDEQTLQATVVSVERGVARARLEGRLKMKHSFYHKDDDKYVEASVVGFMDFEPGPRRLRSLRMVTEQADYRGGGSDLAYGVAVRSVP